jgi:hypothetical protein
MSGVATLFKAIVVVCVAGTAIVYGMNLAGIQHPVVTDLTTKIWTHPWFPKAFQSKSG